MTDQPTEPDRLTDLPPASDEGDEHPDAMAGEEVDPADNPAADVDPDTFDDEPTDDPDAVDTEGA